jgi:type II secretion system protein G
MPKNNHGFTLVELLVVVAIIGILAAFIVPNVATKMQEGKQKATMTDIKTIATAILAYTLVNDEAPAIGKQEGPLTPGNEFIEIITMKHLLDCPVNDRWGNPYIIYTGDSVASFPGFRADMVSKADFLIISYGRDGESDGFSFEPSDRQAGMFSGKPKESYENDLINWNGSWIRAPAVGKASSDDVK